MLEPEFLRVAQERFNPYRPSSGTEHVAFLLYALARMTRPKIVVELGSGYTTLFLLRALADNLRDVGEERIALLKKSGPLFDTAQSDLFACQGNDLQAWDADARDRLLGWLAAGGKACGVDPRFYLTPYEPRLFSFERLGHDHAYVRDLEDAIKTLQLENLFTLLPGQTFSIAALPRHARPLDWAWNDDEDYRGFFNEFWPHLNPEGGLMIFHNVPGTEIAADAVLWMKEQRAAAKDLEVLALEEPHKLNQNGCAILRRVSDYRPRFASSHPRRVLHDLGEFIAGVVRG
ncbi:MAG TPA: hypothetical protein VIC28_10830 [Thermoanaerobaculia bacterium]|jgi:hypothetical protein